MPEPSDSFGQFRQQQVDGTLRIARGALSGCNPFADLANCRISIQRRYQLVGQQGKTIYVLQTAPSAGTQPSAEWRLVALTEL